jgi:hypothetical protein
MLGYFFLTKYFHTCCLWTRIRTNLRKARMGVAQAACSHPKASEAFHTNAASAPPGMLWSLRQNRAPQAQGELEPAAGKEESCILGNIQLRGPFTCPRQEDWHLCAHLEGQSSKGLRTALGEENDSDCPPKSLRLHLYTQRLSEPDLWMTF